MPEKHTALLGAGLVPLPRSAGIAVQVNPRSLITGCCFSFVLAFSPPAKLLAASAQPVLPAPGTGAEGFACPRAGGCPAPAPSRGGLPSGGPVVDVWPMQLSQLCQKVCPHLPLEFPAAWVGIILPSPSASK